LSPYSLPDQVGLLYAFCILFSSSAKAHYCYLHRNLGFKATLDAVFINPS
jgi:hypothetical protein